MRMVPRDETQWLIPSWSITTAEPNKAARGGRPIPAGRLRSKARAVAQMLRGAESASSIRPHSVCGLRLPGTNGNHFMAPHCRGYCVPHSWRGEEVEGINVTEPFLSQMWTQRGGGCSSSPKIPTESACN